MSEPIKCPVWGTYATKLSEVDYGAQVEMYSARAGGRFTLSSLAVQQRVQSLPSPEKAKLSAWVYEQNRLGGKAAISEFILNEIRSSQQPTVPGRINRLLLFLHNQSVFIGQSINLEAPIRLYENSLHPNSDQTERHELAQAASSCLHAGELHYLIDALEVEKLVERGSAGLQITPRGYARIDNLTTEQVEFHQAFVAMWFNPATDEPYTLGIAPAVIETGYKPLRIDKKEHNNKIDDEIIAEIRRSRFLIADFTSERDKPRGGVYFEAGFAKGLNIPVIWTCRSDLIDQVHFDTRQFAHITWNDPADLQQQLRNRILATIGQGTLSVKTM